MLLLVKLRLALSSKPCFQGLRLRANLNIFSENLAYLNHLIVYHRKKILSRANVDYIIIAKYLQKSKYFVLLHYLILTIVICQVIINYF
jgi:hypothetical protein